MGATKADAFAATSQDSNFASEIWNLVEVEVVFTVYNLISWSAEVLGDCVSNGLHSGWLIMMVMILGRLFIMLRMIKHEQ